MREHNIYPGHRDVHPAYDFGHASVRFCDRPTGTRVDDIKLTEVGPRIGQRIANRELGSRGPQRATECLESRLLGRQYLGQQQRATVMSDTLDSLDFLFGRRGDVLIQGEIEGTSTTPEIARMSIPAPD